MSLIVNPLGMCFRIKKSLPTLYSNYYGIIFTLFFSTYVYAQDTIEVSSKVDVSSFLFNNEAPFWFYTNINGLRSKNTNVATYAFAKANYSINENHQIEIGLGGFLRDGFTQEFQRSEIYASYSNKIFSITLGSKNPDDFNQGLSTINNNILYTGNTRAIPGILLETSKPIHFVKWLSADAQLGHYRLNDQRRTEKTNVHFKSLELNWHFNDKTIVSTGLKHYVQWGGVTEDGIQLPNDFRALTTVFVGGGAKSLDNFNESINALGNHLGSYNLAYHRILQSTNELSLYHHTLFDDRSGRELNNFPDGVWGISFKNKKSKWFKNILYEYVQTISQSGRPRVTEGSNQQSGGDNYFSNSIYRSGWTYEGVTIGLPFINPIASEGNPLNNRIIGHHLGLITSIHKIDITTKFTYLQNLGTYNIPLDSREKLLLVYTQISRDLEKLGELSLFLGGDFTTTNSNNLGVGLNYSYKF